MDDFIFGFLIVLLQLLEWITYVWRKEWVSLGLETHQLGWFPERAAGHIAALQCLISLWQLWFSRTERQVKYWWPCSGFSTCYLLGGSAVSLYVEQIICYSKIKPGSPWYKIQDPAIPWCREQETESRLHETFISALAEGVEAPVSRWELLQHVLCGCVTALRILRSPLTSLASTLGSKKGSEGAFSRSRALEQIWEAALC